MTPRQLERVPSNLTPKQAVLAWIKEMQSHDSVIAYARSTVDRPQSRTVYGQIEDAVRKRLSGESKDAIFSAIRRAQREAAFLGGLARECTFSIVTTEESFQLKHAVTVFMLDNMRLHWDLEEAIGPVAFVQLQEWSARLHADCHGHRLAVNTIQSEYFDGHAILSTDAGDTLEARLQMTDDMADRLDLDKGALQKARTSVARTLISRWVNMAKAAAHQAMGQDVAASRLALLAMDA